MLTICHVPFTAPIYIALDALVECCARIIHLQLTADIGQEICYRFTLFQWNRMKFTRCATQLAVRCAFADIIVTPARYLSQFTEILCTRIDVVVSIDLGAGIALR